MAPTQDRTAGSQREMAARAVMRSRPGPTLVTVTDRENLTPASVSRVSAEAWNEASVSHEPWAWVSA